MGDLSRDFSRAEFKCPCGECGGYPVEPRPELVNRLQGMRDRLGRVIVITSGVRCPAHNAAEGGKPTSDHLTGDGADVAALTSRARFQVVEAAIAAGFRRIGINFKRKFVHVGTSWVNDTDVLWGYE